MANTSIGTSEKSAILLLEFKYGDPTNWQYQRVTQFTFDQFLAGNLFTAVPEVDIKMPEQSALLADKSLLIAGPLTVGGGFFDQISNGQPFSLIYVTLYELIRGTAGQPDTVLTHYKGLVTKVVRNYQRPSWVQIEVTSWKSRLNVSLGLPANVQCVWTFGQRGCQVPGGVPTEIGTLTSATGKLVTITGLSVRPTRFWHRGYVMKDGCRIPIRDFVSGTNFWLTKEPPASWLAASVQVFAGCDKTIDTCRSRWNNEQHFGGFGYAIPSWSPNYENT